QAFGQHCQARGFVADQLRELALPRVARVLLQQLRRAGNRSEWIADFVRETAQGFGHARGVMRRSGGMGFDPHAVAGWREAEVESHLASGRCTNHDAWKVERAAFRS